MTHSPLSKRAIAESLVAACREAGTTHVFGVPGGGSNLDVVGAAVDDGLQFVLTHTETAATIMAAVSAQLTGAPGLAVATRGPGAANAVNGVAQALLDRQAMILVTDCVSAVDRDRVSHQRLDQQVLMRSVSKGSVVLDGRDHTAAAQVVHVATGGRPGPVHVDIDPSASGADTRIPDDPTTAEVGEIQQLVDAVRGARRPVVVVGGGAAVQQPATRQRIATALHAMGASHHVPMLTTYQARGMVPDDVSWAAGLATGATIESPLLHEADLVIGVGLDPVELIPAAWPYSAPVVLAGAWAIDDSTWFGDRLVTEVVADLTDLAQVVTDALTSTWPEGSGERHRLRALAELRAARPESPTAVVPQDVVDVVASVAPRGAIATVDAGAHMLVAMPLWPTHEPCGMVISSGLATMGFALPAAIAAALSRPGTPVVCFTGDGGLGMALAELETVARLSLPIVVVVFDDALLSLIAAKQAPAGHGGAAAVEYRPIDFAALARSCGMQAERVATADGLRDAAMRAFASGVPVLLDVAVDPSAYGAVLDAVRGPRRTTG